MQRLVGAHCVINAKRDAVAVAKIKLAEIAVKTHAVGRVPIAKQKLASMKAGWTQSIDKLEELVARA